jgi:hypothetical protein
VIPLGDIAKKVTKRALTEYFSAMLKRYQVGDTISGSDENHLLWLIQQHPEFEKKRGVGITKFTVSRAKMGSQCFAVVRTDGSICDFSYKECITPTPVLTEVLAAMRQEVADDIQEAKLEHFRKHGDERGRVKCALSGELIDISQAHADHAPPRTFNELARMFLAARDIAPDMSLLTPSKDNEYGRRLCIPPMAAAWRSFHHRMAHIRIVSAKENLARAQDGKPRPEDRQLILVGEDQ